MKSGSEFVGACVNFMAVPTRKLCQVVNMKTLKTSILGRRGSCSRSDEWQAYFLESHPDGGTAGAKMGCRWVADGLQFSPWFGVMENCVMNRLKSRCTRCMTSRPSSLYHFHH